MPSSGAPCTSLALDAIIPYTGANIRIQGSCKLPIFARFSTLPMLINTVSIAPGEVTIDNTVYKCVRLDYPLPHKEYDSWFVQFSVNGVAKEIIKTKATVEVIMNSFLEKVFNKVRPAKIRTLVLKSGVTADIIFSDIGIFLIGLKTFNKSSCSGVQVYSSHIL